MRRGHNKAEIWEYTLLQFFYHMEAARDYEEQQMGFAGCPFLGTPKK